MVVLYVRLVRETDWVILLTSMLCMYLIPDAVVLIL